MAGVARMHLLGGFFGVNLIIGVIVACGYYAGGPAVQALLNVIPTWISMVYKSQWAYYLQLGSVYY